MKIAKYVIFRPYPTNESQKKKIDYWSATLWSTMYYWASFIICIIWRNYCSVNWHLAFAAGLYRFATQVFLQTTGENPNDDGIEESDSVVFYLYLSNCLQNAPPVICLLRHQSPPFNVYSNAGRSNGKKVSMDLRIFSGGDLDDCYPTILKFSLEEPLPFQIQRPRTQWRWG